MKDCIAFYICNHYNKKKFIMTCQTQQSCELASTRNTFIAQAQSKLKEITYAFSIQNPVFLTSLAWERLQNFSEEKTFFRLDIEKKGCAGHTFFWKKESSEGPYDIKILHPKNHSLFFVMDKRIIFHCLGLMIDFCPHPLYSKFLFFHHKSKACGCYSSFSLS